MTGGDGPEVYTEVLTKNMTPYVTTQVNFQAHQNNYVKHHNGLFYHAIYKRSYNSKFILFQVSAHTAKKKIAETSPYPREFLQKYDLIKSKK